jgi:parallel beta-helix repeat protein
MGVSMNKRLISVGIVGFVVIVGFLGFITFESDFVYAQTTWYVGSGPGNDSATIQGGIDLADNGDTVFVYSETYYENIIINKTINLTGKERNITIIDGGGNGDVITITSDWVNVSGFNITNSGSGIMVSGIKMNSDFNNITGNTIVFNEIGISYSSSSNNNIIGNNISWNNNVGITFSFSSYNNIINNTISHNERGFYLHMTNDNNIIDNRIISNPERGIDFSDSSGNTIANNILISNTNGGFRLASKSKDNNIIGNNISKSSNGVMLFNSQNNTITGNNASNNNYGILIVSSSSNNTVEDNFLSSNIWMGITISTSSNNTIRINEISNNSRGIEVIMSSNNTLYNNTIYANTEYGIYIADSSNNNTFHHNNIINNVFQVSLDSSSCFNNLWDDSNGEGNFWSDYTGVDDGSGGRTAYDGVGDTEIPHPFIDQGYGYFQLDNYPLVNPVGNYIFLYQGWNLVSIPSIQSDTKLGIVLSPISGSYIAAQWYNVIDHNDHWKHNNTSKQANLNDLHNINHTIGFWIYITKPGGVIFKYLGTKPISNQTIALYPGWNLVGYPSLISYNRTEGLNNLTFGTHLDSIWTYNAATQRWKELNSSNYFEIGRGYYIHSKVKITWEVPL